MKPKNLLLLLVCIILLFTSSCLPQDSQGQILSLEKLQELSTSQEQEVFQETLLEQQLLLEELLSYDEVTATIEHSFIEWMDTQEIVDLSGYSFEFEKDELIMEEYNNEYYKAFNNLLVTLCVEYDWEQLGEQESEICEKIFEQVPQALRSTLVGRFYIDSLDLRCCSMNKVTRHSTQIGFGPKTRDLTLSEEEVLLQDMALDFIKNYNDSSPPHGSLAADSPWNRMKSAALNRFGIEKDRKLLYAEISLFDPLDTEDVEEELEHQGGLLGEAISNNPNTSAFLQEEGASELLVHFLVPWNRQFQKYEFTYKF